MGMTKNKKMIIKGAGKFMAKLPDCDELITLGTLNNMRLDIQMDMVDIEGGDSTVPIDTLLRKKMIDITAEDAKFDLNMVRLVLGAKLREGVGQTYATPTEDIALNNATKVVETADSFTITLTSAYSNKDAVSVFKTTISDANKLTGLTFTSEADEVVIPKGTLTNTDSVKVVYSTLVTNTGADADAYIWILEEKHDVDSNATIEIKYPTLLKDKASVSVRLINENKLLKQITTGVPKEYEYKVDDSTGIITFNSAMTDKLVYVNYKKKEVVDILELKSKDFPLTVHVVHDGFFEQKDGKLQGIQTELYKCRVKSNFTIDAQRQNASTHSVTLTVIDADRADDKLGTIKRYELTNLNVSDIC